MQRAKVVDRRFEASNPCFSPNLHETPGGGVCLMLSAGVKSKRHTDIFGTHKLTIVHLICQYVVPILCDMAECMTLQFRCVAFDCVYICYVLWPFALDIYEQKRNIGGYANFIQIRMHVRRTHRTTNSMNECDRINVRTNEIPNRWLKRMAFNS